MKKHFAIIALAAAALAGCGPVATSENSQRADNATGSRTGAINGGANRAELPPVTSAHGGGAPAATANGPAVPAGKPDMDTAALDAKIKLVEAKAQAAGAGAAEKQAAAAAYVERGNAYRDAGQPQLYKFALGDYRRALRYEPGNATARARMDEIVGIYQSMGRPVPTNGLDEK